MEQIYEIEPLLKAGACIQIYPQGYSLNAYRHFAEELVPEEGAADSVSMEENMPAEEPADETEE